MEFADIAKELVDGKNLGGLAQRFYYGLWTDVESFPTEPSAPITLPSAATLTGDIEMKTGKRMFEFYTTEETAKLDINTIGEEGGKGFELVLSVHAPGLSNKLIGFMNATKNEDLVLIVEDNEGQKYLLGNELRSAKLVGADGAGTGTSKEGKRGFPLSFSFRTGNLYTYAGSIPLTIGT